MIFNEIKCHVNTFLPLVWGDSPPASPPVSAPGLNTHSTTALNTGMQRQDKANVATITICLKKNCRDYCLLRLVYRLKKLATGI